MLIPKLAKDQHEPSSYYPSCVCKTIESMICDRIVWFREANGLNQYIYIAFQLILILYSILIPAIDKLFILISDQLL